MEEGEEEEVPVPGVFCGDEVPGGGGGGVQVGGEGVASGFPRLGGGGVFGAQAAQLFGAAEVEGYFEQVDAVGKQGGFQLAQFVGLRGVQHEETKLARGGGGILIVLGVEVVARGEGVEVVGDVAQAFFDAAALHGGEDDEDALFFAQAQGGGVGEVVEGFLALAGK